MTDVLKTAKNALDSGLITQIDYDGVKGAFLKAQQIKAGLDAGFILQQDYDQVKAAFLHSLSLGPGGSVVVNLPGTPQGKFLALNT
jgi:cofilin